MGPGGRSAVNGVVPNCFPPAKIEDPGGSLVKTTWPPLLTVAAAMTTLSSNVSLISPKNYRFISGPCDGRGWCFAAGTNISLIFRAAAFPTILLASS
jgi:hypothetical protein